jgi:hypothetical protein
MQKLNKILLVLCLFIAALIAGCAGGPQYSVGPTYQSAPPRSIAVLPVFNETVNLKAQDLIRPILHNKIAQKGYEAPPSSFIDAKLLEKEIREAGQINTLTTQELGKLLGVDAILYSTIQEFNTTYIIAYASITVSMHFELKDAKTGEKLWETDHQVKESKLGLDSKTLQETLQFAALQSYTPYCQKCVDESFTTLPDGPFVVKTPSSGCLAP